MRYNVVDGKLNIPEGEEYILEETYQGMDEIVEVYLPKSMKVIGPVAFCECKNITKVYLNGGLIEIGDGAFLGNLSLTEIEFPKSLKRIGPMAFWNSSLRQVVIPQEVEVVGESAFWDSSNLERVDVLGEKTLIEDSAFGNCQKLVRGYIAPGFNESLDAPSKLLYSLLWLSSYDKHNKSTEKIAKEYIKKNQDLIIEHILKAKNIYALNGLVKLDLLDKEIIENALKLSAKLGYPEIVAMLLNAKNQKLKSQLDEMDEFLL